MGGSSLDGCPYALFLLLRGKVPDSSFEFACCIATHARLFQKADQLSSLGRQAPCRLLLPEVMNEASQRVCSRTEVRQAFRSMLQTHVRSSSTDAGFG